jgi:hypothetical protein
MNRGTAWYWIALPPVVLTVLSVLSGCGPRASQGGFDSDNPAAKLYAIRDAGARRDTAAIPKLVEQLTSDDPAVRVFAIEALERITGERLGYNPSADLLVRAEAVDRWEQAVRDGRFTAGSPQVTEHGH